MFDVGFSELVLIALVALIVIGPERLPKVARTAGVLLGRLQRYVNDVKSDINREIQLEEIKKMQSEVTAQVRDMEKSVNEQLTTVETELNQSIGGAIENKDSVAAPLATETVPAAVVAAVATEMAPAAVAAETPRA
ncbi:MAG: twin-arginine translocase subunit TatB [Rhodocyclales bacterium]|nr:twin-arginine translocase subunit TatB [Rhodocyclales bacterium]